MWLTEKLGEWLGFGSRGGEVPYTVRDIGVLVDLGGGTEPSLVEQFANPSLVGTERRADLTAKLGHWWDGDGARPPDNADVHLKGWEYGLLLDHPSTRPGRGAIVFLGIEACEQLDAEHVKLLTAFIKDNRDELDMIDLSNRCVVTSKGELHTCPSGHCHDADRLDEPKIRDCTRSAGHRCGQPYAGPCNGWPRNMRP